MRSGFAIGLVCLAALGLSGCVVALPRAASERTEVLDGTLTLAAPPGFCVDGKSVQSNADGAFVLWGLCAAMSRFAEAPKPAHKAMLSASIGPLAPQPLETAFDRYESFLRTEAGRAALARSGLASDVEILEITREPGLMLLKIADRSAPPEAAVEQVYWRAVTAVAGRVGALSVLPLVGSGMDDAAQIALLHSFDASIRAAN